MNRKRLLAITVMMASMTANAQLVSVDGGTAAIDGNGLMWANTVGFGLGWSPTGGAGSAQAWVAGLNAGDYGGHDDWTLATGDGSFGANTTTNQLGELFYADCGNSVGAPTGMNNAGKNCTALSAVVNANAIGVGYFPPNNAIYFSGSLNALYSVPGGDTYFWTYQTLQSIQPIRTNDTVVNGVTFGDALAVRSAPEIDPSSACSALTLLFGSLAVLRGRRARPA